MDYNAYFNVAIARGSYELSDMEERIDRCWMDGNITTAQRDALRTLAAESADDAAQINMLAQLADLERRVFILEHPTDIYVIWTSGYQTQQHEIVRYDVTGDGEYDLCQYNGGRSYTALSIGKIEGWNLLDIELNITHTITRGEDGGYILTPVDGTDSDDEEASGGDEDSDGEEPTE